MHAKHELVGVDRAEHELPALDDATETADPADRHQVLTADETAVAVARAPAALAEIRARAEVDAAREARDAEDTNRREELARWSADDQAAEAAGGRSIVSREGDASVAWTGPPACGRACQISTATRDVTRLVTRNRVVQVEPVCTE